MTSSVPITKYDRTNVRVQSYRATNPDPEIPVTTIVHSGKRVMKNLWETQTLTRMQIAIIAESILDLSMSVLVLIMLFLMLDISQSWLTLLQIMHIYTWLIALSSAYGYDLGWTTATMVIYIFALIGDITGFIWRIVELIDAGLNTFFLVVLGIQTAAVGFLIIFDLIAIVVLAIMRKQLFPYILKPTTLEIIEMWQNYASNVNIVQAVRKRFKSIEEVEHIWEQLNQNTTQQRMDQGLPAETEAEDHTTIENRMPQHPITGTPEPVERGSDIPSSSPYHNYYYRPTTTPITGTSSSLQYPSFGVRQRQTTPM